ncbi:MAG: pyridoxine 5'-phosphate synthase [Phycisphaerales bacterium]|nr:pyridoxine 5'-phosphate synthase [Phycisphaerales bacterium]
MALLSVNIDHVATLRQARYRKGPDYGEPDICRAAHEAEMGGADGLTMHLREDRRHVIDRDIERVRELARVKFNLEMAATTEMVRIAARVKPHTAMLVPEGRDEVTTEGGLDCAGGLRKLKGVVARLKDAGCVVSAFIDPDSPQIEAAYKAGFDVCEVHTGPYARAFARAGGDMFDRRLTVELERIAIAGGEILARGMRFNAGHALNYINVMPVAAMPGVAELHIGHAIISRAVFGGLRSAVAEMKSLLVRAEDFPMHEGDHP